MVAVQSLGAMVSVEPGWRPALSYGSVQLYDTHYYTYARLFREQPNVRTCVEFLARNIAQLGLHVFRRVGETDRQRLRDHPLAQLIERPLPAEFKVTRYSLITALMSDLGIYFNAYWLKVKGEAGLGSGGPSGPRMGLLRIPPEYVTASGGLVPTGYEISVGGQAKRVGPEEIVHFKGYNPETSLSGLSPLETLRRILAEEQSAGDYRENFWRNAARMGGIVERPKDAPEWSDGARQRFRSEFEALYSGGPNSGKTAILEEGMTWKEQTFNAQESEFLAGRKLTREECARAYHIPLPMVGILDHATFCLPARVPVFTSEGPRPIAEVGPGDLVWSHDGNGFALRPVTWSGQTGIDPLLRIRTQTRTLEANATHPILVRRQVRVPGVADPTASAKRRAGQSRWHYEPRHVYVSAQEIRRGDVLVVLNELPRVGVEAESISRMEFYGLYLGDGNLMRNRGQPCGVAISRAENAPYMDHYREEMRRFTGCGGRLITLDDTGHPRQSRFMSADAARLMIDRGLGGTAKTKRIPSWVFAASAEARLAFLRGYLDSDGSVDKKGRISYSSSSPDLIEDVRHLCMSVGVPVNNAYHFTGTTVLPNGQMADVSQWTITCADPGANRRIGSHDPRYTERLAHGKPFGRKKHAYPFAKGQRAVPPEGCGYSRVVSIEALPAEPVYDLEVEGTHNFVAAGVIVHNSNIREQHKNLYQDSLGPWMAMIEQDIQLQLLPDFEDTEGVYCEFNIAEKLQGSFEEQTKELQGAVGRPWMTADEARARMNLPSMGGDAEQLVTPLNVLVGGQASAQDSAPEESRERVLSPRMGPNKTNGRGRIDPTLMELRARHQEKWRQVLAGEFKRQREAVIGHVPGESRERVLSPRIGPNRTNGTNGTNGRKGIGEIWDAERWNRELQVDLFRLNRATSLVWAKYVAQQLEAEVSEEGMDAWLDEHSRIQAEGINGVTRDQLADALTQDDPRSAVEHLFELALTVRVAQIAVSAVTASANFGSAEGARAGGLRSKAWQVNSANPRPAHAAMNGETVGIGELFSNGAKWPGDPILGADGNANCECSCVFGTE